MYNKYALAVCKIHNSLYLDIHFTCATFVQRFEPQGWRLNLFHDDDDDDDGDGDDDDDELQACRTPQPPRVQ